MINLLSHSLIKSHANIPRLSAAGVLIKDFAHFVSLIFLVIVVAII